jgi:hypothetical protein
VTDFLAFFSETDLGTTSGGSYLTCSLGIYTAFLLVTTFILNFGAALDSSKDVSGGGMITFFSTMGPAILPRSVLNSLKTSLSLLVSNKYSSGMGLWPYSAKPSSSESTCSKFVLKGPPSL